MLQLKLPKLPAAAWLQNACRSNTRLTPSLLRHSWSSDFARRVSADWHRLGALRCHTDIDTGQEFRCSLLKGAARCVPRRRPSRRDASRSRRCIPRDRRRRRQTPCARQQVLSVSIFAPASESACGLCISVSRKAAFPNIVRLLCDAAVFGAGQERTICDLSAAVAFPHNSLSLCNGLQRLRGPIQPYQMDLHCRH